MSNIGRVGKSSTSEKSFRNPHNLPVKDCVVCRRPFTWRKKWEKCWDEVLTCSQRCKTARRSGNKGDALKGAAATAVLLGGAGGRKGRAGAESIEDVSEAGEES